MLDYGIEVQGYSNLLRNFEQMPLMVKEMIREKMEQYSDQMLGDLQDDIAEKIIGDDSTGQLEQSAQSYVMEEGSGVTLVVGFDGTVDYARIQDRGGTTSPHMIYPNKGKVLAFMGMQGKMAFATRVFHPGATIPAKNYLKDLRLKYAAKISRELKATIVRGLREEMRASR